MFKRFFRRAKSRDQRFVDTERYAERSSYTASSSSEDQEFIRVQNSTEMMVSYSEHEILESSLFLERIKHAIIPEEIITPDTQILDDISTPVIDLSALNSLGIISDSKIYSALIHSVLTNYHLNIKHFNHPDTFVEKHYDFFDSISSWIIFLSDEQECDFLDRFLDRYVDKPTLFLFSKLNKDASVKRIQQFIQQHNLSSSLSSKLTP